MNFPFNYLHFHYLYYCISFSLAATTPSPTLHYSPHGINFLHHIIVLSSLSIYRLSSIDPSVCPSTIKIPLATISSTSPHHESTIPSPSWSWSRILLLLSSSSWKNSRSLQKQQQQSWIIALLFLFSSCYVLCFSTTLKKTTTRTLCHSEESRKYPLIPGPCPHNCRRAAVFSYIALAQSIRNLKTH